MNGVLTLFLAIICALSLVSGQFSTSLSSSSSNIFRTSPFGRCGSQTVDLRESSYPCLSPRQYAFAQLASTNATIPSIASLLGNDLNGIRTVYIGNAIGGIQVVHPNQAGFNGSFGTSVQNIPGPGGANPAGLIASFTDKTSFVAFVDSNGAVSKYSLLPDGTFNTNLTTTANTGVQGTISVIVQLPNVYIAGGTRIATLDTTTMISTNVNAPATIACGVAADANTNFIYYSTTSGTIFAYNTASKSVAGTVTVNGVTSFSPACGARPGTYGLFVSKPAAGTTASIYQYGYSQAQGIGNLEYVVDGIGNLGQTPGPSAMNADSSALYFVTYTPDGTITYLANIYEFRLYDDSFDFMSVTQEEQIPNTVFINPTIITPLVGNSIYIGANTPQIPRVYEFFVPSAYGGPSNNTNITTTFNLIPDPLPAKNPDGAPGKVNSIADVGQVFGNGDIIFGNGIGYYPTAPANTTTVLNSRGAQITYIRGTTTEAPAHAGLSNNNGISLKLVSLDEVSSSGLNSSVKLIKSIPIYDSNDAPWFSPRSSNQFANGGGAVTGITWNFGQTETTDNAAVMYSYLVPPYARVSVNGTIPQPATPSKKRSPAPGPNQYTPGYMSMSVTISTFPTNTSTGFIVGTPYNITSRYVQYDFTVTNFPFTSNANILRLTMALGVGLDGNSSLGAFPIGANSTTPPLVPGYMFLTPTADWTVLLPQKATLNNVVSAAPHACTYDLDSHLLSLYMPSGTNVTTGYTLFVEYSYVPPPPIPPNNEDGGGPKLLPLWIVIGVVGGIVIIAIIVAIIVVVVVYKVAGDKIKAWILDQQMDMTEGALREDRGAFPS